VHVDVRTVVKSERYGVRDGTGVDDLGESLANLASERHVLRERRGLNEHRRD
jgi:hypothetical protein